MILVLHTYMKEILFVVSYMYNRNVILQNTILLFRVPWRLWDDLSGNGRV